MSNQLKEAVIDLMNQINVKYQEIKEIKYYKYSHEIWVLYVDDNDLLQEFSIPYVM